MKMSELMREVAGLPKARQNELAAFLLHLRLQQDFAWQKEMGRRIDDTTPGNWASLSRSGPAGMGSPRNTRKARR
jgi:hypothetical protein